jgi:hypothetical protein
MPPIAVLGPIAFPLVAAGLIGLIGLTGRNAQWVAAAGAWASAIALCAVWLPVRASQELNLGSLGLGSSLVVRVDAVAFAFGLMVLIPAAVLLTFQARAWQEASLAIIGVAGAMAAVEAGDVVSTAIAGGATASLAVVLLDVEDARASRPRWILLFAAWLALGWAGAILQGRGGTADYTAVPVSTLTIPVFGLVAVAALLASGLLPWRSWPAQVWSRPSLRTASITVATLFPLGFYLLTRAYEMGGGHYPRPLFNAGLSALGVLVALGAAVRAQAAATRREFLGEVIPGLGGFALMAIALGTPLGLSAALITLATASAFVACLSLVPDRGGLPSLIAIAAAAGLPPGLAFGSRVMGVESTFEAGDFLGLIGLGGVVAWAVWMAGSARAVGLPAGRGRAAAETLPWVALAIALLTIVTGPALAVVQTVLASPVQAAVMPAVTGPPAGGLTSVVMLTTVLPAMSLFVPLLLIGAAVYAWAGASSIRSQARPTLFAFPANAAVERAVAAFRSASVPEQYRSILSVRELELAAAGANPVLWLAALVALTYAVTR